MPAGIVAISMEGTGRLSIMGREGHDLTGSGAHRANNGVTREGVAHFFTIDRVFLGGEGATFPNEFGAESFFLLRITVIIIKKKP